MPSREDASPIDPQVRIGHVHLKVADLERSLRFYCGVLGFQVTQRYGTQAAFVSAGGYHHHIGLNTWESLGGSPPPPGPRGSITSPSSTPTGGRSPTPSGVSSPPASRWTGPPTTASARRSTCVTRTRTGWNSTGIGRKRSWPRTPGGELAMFTRRLDLDGLLNEVEAEADAPEVEEGPRDL